MKGFGETKKPHRFWYRCRIEGAFPVAKRVFGEHLTVTKSTL